MWEWRRIFFFSETNKGKYKTTNHLKESNQQFQRWPLILCRESGSRFWLQPQYCRNPLSIIFLPALPSRSALACLFCFSLIFHALCAILWFKACKDSFWYFSLSTRLLGLLLCYATNPSVCSLCSSCCYSTCFGTVSQHWFAQSWLTKALQRLYALVEHTTSFAHFLSFTTSSEVVIYVNAHQASFLFIGTDSNIWNVEETVLHNVWRKLHYRWALILAFKSLPVPQNSGKSTVNERYPVRTLSCLPAAGLCFFPSVHRLSPPFPIYFH